MLQVCLAVICESSDVLKLVVIVQEDKIWTHSTFRVYLEQVHRVVQKDLFLTSSYS